VEPERDSREHGQRCHLPVITVGGASFRKWLAERGVRVVVTDPTASMTLWDATLTGPLALVLGAEHAGVPEAWRDVARQRMAIPMHGAADSLNVSVSGALVLYEALRQRHVAP
jgi:rRNA methylases